MFKLSDNLLESATKHYSTISMYLGYASILIPYAMAFVGLNSGNPNVWAAWGLGFLTFGLFGKFIVQTDANKWKRRVFIFAVFMLGVFVSIPAMAYTYAEEMAETINHIKLEEGAVINAHGFHEAYYDQVGICTYCYGDTDQCHIDIIRTEAQCEALLQNRVHTYRNGVRAAMTSEARENRLTLLRAVAFTGWTYNIGVGAAQKSTAIRRINRGEIAGACKAMTWFNKAGGRVIRGLVIRRGREYQMCMAEAPKEKNVFVRAYNICMEFIR